MVFRERVAVLLSRQTGLRFDRDVAVPPVDEPIDLVSKDGSWAVECGVYGWTASGRIQSTTISVIRASLRRLASLPPSMHKVLALARDVRPPQPESLAGYFVRMEGRTLGEVTVIEVDEKTDRLRVLAGSPVSRAAESS